METKTDYIDIFIPSYHRSDNIKTVNYFLRIGWPADKLHVFIDDATDDIDKYRETAEHDGFQLHVFDMKEARRRYDYVHRVSESRRSAGQARNMFQDFARENGITFYMAQDDDTSNYQVRPFGKYFSTVKEARILNDTFIAVREMMMRYHIGLFGLSQGGDMYSNEFDTKLYRSKVMNTTFYLMPYIYRGERGIQDDDTSLFVGVMNEGLFTGSLAYGLVLQQTPSATAKGGLTDLYNECKLLNKSLVTPIQFPSAIYAEKQPMNGNRIHHRIMNKYLMPRIIRVPDAPRTNVPWDTYPEDVPFTNEPRRSFILNDANE